MTTWKRRPGQGAAPTTAGRDVEPIVADPADVTPAQRWAAAWLAVEHREPTCPCQAGWALYAWRGRQTTYMLPPLAPERGNQRSAIQDGKGEPAFRHSGGKGEPAFRQSARKGEPPFPPSPQLAKKQQRAEAIVTEHTGATPQEAAAVVETLRRTRPDIRSLPVAHEDALITNRGVYHRGPARPVLLRDMTPAERDALPHPFDRRNGCQPSINERRAWDTFAWDASLGWLDGSG